jgi:hypothetical protein
MNSCISPNLVRPLFDSKEMTNTLLYLQYTHLTSTSENRAQHDTAFINTTIISTSRWCEISLAYHVMDKATHNPNIPINQPPLSTLGISFPAPRMSFANRRELYNSTLVDDQFRPSNLRWAATNLALCVAGNHFKVPVAKSLVMFSWQPWVNAVAASATVPKAAFQH